MCRCEIRVLKRILDVRNWAPRIWGKVKVMFIIHYNGFNVFRNNWFQLFFMNYMPYRYEGSLCAMKKKMFTKFIENKKERKLKTAVGTM